jgi:hypothetical protein
MNLQTITSSTQTCRAERRHALCPMLAGMFAVLICWPRTGFATPVIHTDQGPLILLNQKGPRLTID